jgi:DNA-binding PucR family transcriptional regulator
MRQPVSAEVLDIFAALRDRLDDLVREVIDDVWHRVEGYRDTLDSKEDLAGVVYHSLDVVLAATTASGSIDEHDIADAHRLGETRALQGVPATSLVQSYRTAERVLVDAFLSVAAGLDGPRCGEGVRSLVDVLDQLQRAAVMAHSRTEQQVALAHEATIGALLIGLASGVGVDVESVVSQAAVIGVDPHRSYVGVAVATPEEVVSDRIPNLRRQLARRMAEAEHAKVPSVTWQGLMLFLLPASATDAKRRQYLSALATRPPIGAPLVVGVGETADDLVGAGLSFRQAADAARLGSRRNGPGTAVIYADVALQALLASDHHTCRTLVKHHLGALLEHPELLETARHFVAADLSVQRAADALHLHPNTISYRVRRVREVGGIDLRSSGDVLRFQVALLALDLLPPPSEA